MEVWTSNNPKGNYQRNYFYRFFIVVDPGGHCTTKWNYQNTKYTINTKPKTKKTTEMLHYATRYFSITKVSNLHEESALRKFSITKVSNLHEESALRKLTSFSGCCYNSDCCLVSLFRAIYYRIAIS